VFFCVVLFRVSGYRVIGFKIQDSRFKIQRVTSYKQSATSDQPPATSHQRPATSYERISLLQGGWQK